MIQHLFLCLLILFLSACDTSKAAVDYIDGDSSSNNSGSNSNGGGDGGNGSNNCGAIAVIIRDFKQAHPDMELSYDLFDESNSQQQLVLSELGSDHKPVYNAAVADGTADITSETSFNQWYNDTDGVNQRLEKEIILTNRGSSWVYDSDELTPPSFFPIDNEGFGNEGLDHNFHFTLELHAEFTYQGGEIFTFSGDDDLWMFVNNGLAIDLGGLHVPEQATANMDDLAPSLDLAIGETYPLDLFFAERHTDESNFRVETTIECVTAVNDVF